MLLYNLRDLADNPAAFAAILAAILLSFVTGIAFHEFCHAWAANELGDPTAKNQGRLTLNPIAHIDPAGFILLVLVGFGWGRPTPVNPYRLRNGVKRGNMLVALAGPASNFMFAILAAIPLRLGLASTNIDLDNLGDASGGEIAGLFLFFLVFYNVLLGLFNLIPIPPLDGFKVLGGFVSDNIYRQMLQLERYGPAILITAIMIGWVAPELSPINFIIGPLRDRIFDLIL